MTFEDLAIKTVGLAYANDKLTAGIVQAKLPEPDCWYASIVRYPEGIDGPKVIAAHGYSKVGSKHAMQMLMLSWTSNPTPGAQVYLVRKFARISGEVLRKAKRMASA